MRINMSIKINQLDTQMIEAFSGPATLATIITMVNGGYLKMESYASLVNCYNYSNGV